MLGFKVCVHNACIFDFVLGHELPFREIWHMKMSIIIIIIIYATSPRGAVVSVSGFGLGGLGFESHQRRGNFSTLDRLQPRVSGCGLNGKTETTQSSFIRLMDAILRVLLQLLDQHCRCL